MRFALAVVLVCGFGGVAVYARMNGHEGLYWPAFAAAVISPWFCGMQFGGATNPDEEASDDAEEDEETR